MRRSRRFTSTRVLVALVFASAALTAAPASAAEQLDQSQETWDDHWPADHQAQSFRAGKSGALTRIDVEYAGACSTPVTLTLREGNESRAGSPLAEQTVVQSEGG